MTDSHLYINTSEVERLLRWAQMVPEIYWEDEDGALARRLRDFFSRGKIIPYVPVENSDNGTKLYVGQIWEKTGRPPRHEAQISALDENYAYMFWAATNRETRVKRSRLRGKHHWRLVR